MTTLKANLENKIPNLALAERDWSEYPLLDDHFAEFWNSYYAMFFSLFSLASMTAELFDGS